MHPDQKVRYAHRDPWSLQGFIDLSRTTKEEGRETQNNIMVWVGKDLKDHLVSPPLPWAQMPIIRPGWSGPHLTWPWSLPGRGIHHFLDNLFQCLTTPTVKISSTYLISACPGRGWPWGLWAHRLVSCPLIKATDPHPKRFAYIFSHTANSVARAKMGIQNSEHDANGEGLWGAEVSQLFSNFYSLLCSCHAPCKNTDSLLMGTVSLYSRISDFRRGEYYRGITQNNR